MEISHQRIRGSRRRHASKRHQCSWLPIFNVFSKRDLFSVGDSYAVWQDFEVQQGAGTSWVDGPPLIHKSSVSNFLLW